MSSKQSSDIDIRQDLLWNGGSRSATLEPSSEIGSLNGQVFLDEDTPKLEDSCSVAVSILRGSILQNENTFLLTPRELELAVALAVLSPCRPDLLTEYLWPDSDGDRARSLLKVYIHRLRRKTTRGLVHSKKSTYELSPTVAIDTKLIEEELRKATRQFGMGNAVDNSCLDMARELRLKRPQQAATWSWFTPHCQRFSSVGRAFALDFSRYSMRIGDFENALLAARQLTCEDECDEEARELVIRSHLRRGEQGAALQEFRRFSVALARDIGVRPSPDLRELFDSANY